MPCVADRSATSERSVSVGLPDMLVLRLTVLGAAALGFLITFMLLDHEIHRFQSVILPLLAILPAYVILMSLNTWWTARSMAKQGLRLHSSSTNDNYKFRMQNIVQGCGGFAFGALAALWYVHWVR